MLKCLKIKNVALISEAEIEFGDKLNVLSGETGAGKSVLLECVNFALGQKADKTMITSGENACSVVCVFDVSDNDQVKDVLDELEIEYDDEIIVKRTFSVDGKSSIKLNGESVNATMLRKVTSLLVDVHGQSDHFALLNDRNQLELIDNLGGDAVKGVKAEISDKIEKVKDVQKKLDNLGGSAEERSRRIDYLTYCIKEIDAVGFTEGEDEELLSQKKKLINSEKIISAITEATEKLSGDNSAVDLVTEAERCVSQIMQYDAAYAEMTEVLSDVIDRLGDVSAKLKDSFDMDFDPKELDVIEDRLDKINFLKSKYGKTYEDIRAKYAAFAEEVELLSQSEENAAKFEKERSVRLAELDLLYGRLTEQRKKVAKDLSAKLSSKLKELAMKNASFDVDFEKTENTLSALGTDKVTFLFTANLGEPLKPLSKVISGGELSRLMLAIKTVTGDAINRSTYVFDEIDAGISGNAARVVAENFAQISVGRQIIAISHLPQIVAMADTSLLIRKNETDSRTYTEVVTLDEEGVVNEVLRLIGGIESASGRMHAKEMVSLARDYKKNLKR